MPRPPRPPLGLPALLALAALLAGAASAPSPAGGGAAAVVWDGGATGARHALLSPLAAVPPTPTVVERGPRLGDGPPTLGADPVPRLSGRAEDRPLSRVLRTPPDAPRPAGIDRCRWLCMYRL